jgi:hypothetical protein
MGESGMKMLHDETVSSATSMNQAQFANSQGDNRPAHGKASAEQEDDLVGMQNFRVDMAQAIRQQAAENVDDAQHGVPRGIALRLLAASVPHLDDGDERGGWAAEA